MTMQPATLSVFLALFFGVTVIGFFAARWRRGDLNQLHNGAWADGASVP